MRIHHLIVLVAVIFPITPAFSYQDHSVIDSLKQLLQQENVSLSTYGVLAGKIYNYDTKASHYYASQMDSLAEVRKDTVNIIEAKNQLAEFFWRTGAYEEATHFALEALSIAEVWKKSPYKLARTHQTLGTIYLYLANSEKALENYNKALVIFTELNKPVDIAKVNNNSGVIYMDMKTEEGIAWGYDSAIARFKKVLDYQGLANNSTIINSMSNLIFLYKEMNMLESGMEILEKWDKFVAEEGPISSSSKAMTYGSIAGLYALNGEIKKALSYYEEGLALASELEMQYDIQAYYDELSLLYEKIGNTEKALEFVRKKDVLKDSLYAIEKINTINELNIKYETEKKEAEITRLGQKNIIFELENEREKQLRLFLFTVTVLLILTVLLVYNRYLFKHRTNKLLDEKNKNLIALNQAKDKLFALVSHDLKNPVSAFHSVAHSLSQNIDLLTRKDIHEYLKTLDESSQKLNDLLQNLLSWAISESGGFSCNPEAVPLKEATAHVIKNFTLNADLKNISIENKVTEDLRAHSDIKMFNAILRNLVGNAIKFTRSGGKVTLEAFRENGSIIYSVNDNGIGITKEDQEKLFRPGYQVQEIGDSEEKGTGFGLLLVKELVEMQDGKIWLDSEPEKGTKFTFSLKSYVAD